MKLSLELKTMLVLFILLLASLLASQYWGVFSSKPGMTSLQLVSFDKKIGEKDNACYLLEVKPLNLPRKTISFTETTSGKITLETKLTLDNKKQSINNCIDSGNLSQGNNFIELRAGDDRLFFNVEKTSEAKKLTPGISIQSINDGKIAIEVKNNDGLSFEPLTIYVNGVKDHSLYPSKENGVLEEKINLSEGNNRIKITFKEATAEAEYFKQKEFSLNPFIGIILVVLLFGAFMLFVFAEKTLIERIAFSLAVMFIVLMAMVYALLLMNALTVESLLTGVLLVIIGIAVVLRKKLRLSYKKIELKKLSALTILLVALLVGCAFLFYFFSPHYLSIWTNFYERQTDLIVKEKALLLKDPLSSLGEKPNGYLSGYFLLNAGIALLSGLSNPGYFALTELLAKLFVFASAFVLFRSIKLSREKSCIAMLLFFMTGFVFGDVLFSSRHLIALGLSFLGIASMIEKKPLLAGLLIAFSAFVQAPVILLALIAAIVLVPKKQLKQAAKGIGFAIIIGLILFLYLFLNFGIPVQAKATTWGHLNTIPLYGVLVDLFAPLLFIFLFLGPYIIKREIMLDAFSKKLFAAIIVLLLIQAFISYRVNVATALLLAVLLTYLFPKKALQARYANYAIAAAFAIGLGVAFSVALGFGTPLSITDAASFVKGNTSTNANLLVEPVLGHSITFFGERKVLADLAVEYSDAGMIDDSYKFLKESDKGIIEKYGIDFTVNRREQITEQPVGPDFFERILEFEFLDKVYSNGFLFVHAKR